MFTRRTMIAFIAAGAALGLGGASAAERVPFDRSAFDAAVKAGGPVLVDVFATWCSTCKAQSAVLARLFAGDQFDGFKVFVVDYDTEKDIMRTFGVQQRSTLIAFSGGVEVGRLTARTDTASIEALLAKAI